VAEIFRRHFDAFRYRHVPTQHSERVARDVMRCRTAALGGHLDVCSSCGFERPAYNSCRNRHCPKCQTLRQLRWVQKRMTRILPVHYFHVVFTLPSELQALIRQNRALLYDLMLRSAAQSLETLALDPKWLGHSAKLGVTCVLHTWTRELTFHPHVHCIVTGGGLSIDGERWISAPPDFLFPVHVLGRLFRGKFLAGLAALATSGKLKDDACDRAARRRRQRLYEQSWVAYAKRPFGGPEQVFRYLGNYTHRVAISNSRLLKLDNEQVLFRTRGQATTSCSPIEFIGRFLAHVLPPRFVKIRHFGLFAAVHVHHQLEQARLLLKRAPANQQLDDPPPASSIADLDFAELLLRLTGTDLAKCPNCDGRTMVRIPLAAACRGPPLPRMLA
jgi:hypothetical protein